MKQVVGVILLILLGFSFAIANSIPSRTTKDYECNQSGYDEYLKKWSTYMKSSSRDSSSIEYQKRLGIFIDNCKKIHEWNSEDKYRLELTYYADGILADDEGEVVSDVAASVGWEFDEHFGEFEETTVYVKNDTMKAYYVVAMSEDEYAEVFDV